MYKKLSGLAFTAVLSGAVLSGATITAVQAQSLEADTSPPAEAKAQSSLEEVVVYARRRQELLQQTPVAVTAFSGDQLAQAGIKNILDLNKVVPSLSISEDGSKEPKFFIRGIGARSGGTFLDPGVGIYLNEILIPRPIGQLLETIDIESVQVLRGPQGTLFGKNNTGGAILFRTAQPNLSEGSTKISAIVGNYDRRDIKLLTNIPVIEDELAVRFSLSRTYTEGFLENVTDGETFSDEDRIGASLRVLWDIDENFSADLFGFWSKTDEFSQGPTCVFQNPNASLPNLVFPQQPAFSDACRESEALREERKISYNSEESFFEVESSMVALTLRWMLTDDIEVKSITGYSRWDDVYVNDDLDGTRAIIVSGGSKAVGETLEGSGYKVADDDRWQLTQEFKFTGTAFNERMDYTVGVFASTERMPSVLGNQLVGPGGIGGIPFSFVTGLFVPIPGLSDALGSTADQASIVPFAEWLGESSKLRNDSMAVFGEFTLELADWLEFTLGGRYTKETRDRETLVTEVDTVELGNRLGATYVEQFGVFTPISRAQFDAQFDDKRNLPLLSENTVIGASRDFTEFTPSATLSMLAPGAWVDAMQLNSFLTYVTYSKGFKAGGIDARGQELVGVEPEFVTNIELGFKLDAVDSRFRFNASIFHTEWEDMQIQTNELGDSITGTEILQFYTNAGASTIDGVELESAFTFANWFVNFNASYLDATFHDFMGNAVTPFVGERPVDRSKEPFFVTPKLTYSLSAYYKLLTPVGMFIPRFSASYRDEVFTGLDYLADSFESAHIEEVTVYDARLIYQPSERVQVTAFVENVTDKVYYTSGFSNSGALGAGLMISGKPRTFGLEVSVEFY